MCEKMRTAISPRFRDQHLLDRHGAQLTEASYSRDVIRLPRAYGDRVRANAIGLIVVAALPRRDEPRRHGVRHSGRGLHGRLRAHAAVLLQRAPTAAAPVLGGVALIATLVSLIVATLVTDGLSISGIGTWIAATVVVWLASILAGFILPFLGLKKYLDERRD